MGLLVTSREDWDQINGAVDLVPAEDASDPLKLQGDATLGLGHDHHALGALLEVGAGFLALPVARGLAFPPLSIRCDNP